MNPNCTNCQEHKHCRRCPDCFNYVEKARKALAEELDWEYIPDLGDPLPKPLPDRYTPLLDLYTLLVFTKGTNCTLEDIHDAWSVWCNVEDKPYHKSLIPFNELTKEVQELDRKYCEAVIKVANLLT